MLDEQKKLGANAAFDLMTIFQSPGTGLRSQAKIKEIIRLCPKSL